MDLHRACYGDFKNFLEKYVDGTGFTEEDRDVLANAWADN